MELDVLQSGGSRALSISKYVHIEVATRQMYEGQPLQGEVDVFFHTNNFRQVEKAIGWIYGNVLYERNQS
jgi:hypothetical protein